VHSWSYEIDNPISDSISTRDFLLALIYTFIAKSRICGVSHHCICLGMLLLVSF
jgi:hypothetical protein